MPIGQSTSLEADSSFRVFLIADVRGYTRFTQREGDAAAARLATKFARIARDAVAARSGRVIELRGDEVLAGLPSPAQAVRAALELQATCVEETEAEPDLPLHVGIGIDAGEAVPVEDGFRGAALNMAARLCSFALAGEVLVTPTLAEQAITSGNGDFELRPHRDAQFKGIDEPVEVMKAADRPPSGSVMPFRSAEAGCHRWEGPRRPRRRAALAERYVANLPARPWQGCLRLGACRHREDSPRRRGRRVRDSRRRRCGQLGRRR